MATPLHVCILAAGIGSRMKSDTPKVLRTLAGKPLLAHLLQTVQNLRPTATHVVIDPAAKEIKAVVDGDINWVYQKERRGTGHAVQQIIPHLDENARVLILLGDAPLVETGTLQALVAGKADLTVLTVNMTDPYNYGRIVREGEQVVAIVEQVDATVKQQAITEINTGVMVADAGNLCGWLALLDDDNAQGELLLTDIVKHANASSATVRAHLTQNVTEVTGVNTFSQLAGLERALQMNIAEKLMDQGVQLMDPARRPTSLSCDHDAEDLRVWVSEPCAVIASSGTRGTA